MRPPSLSPAFTAAPAAVAGRPSAAARWPERGRLSLGALGLALTLTVCIAWGTGLFYLLVRLGAGSPVRLASLDGIHVYSGVAGGVFVLAKVVRVGLRHRVEGVPRVVPWQRWLSLSMLVLYAAVFVTGVLLLLPVRGRPYADLVQLHLLTSVWALLPTTWHTWHYRARARPYLRRWASRLAGRRFWIGMALVALPLPVLLADSPPVSQLPAVLGGASWSPVAALQGSYLGVIARAPDGTLVAAGDALYVSRDAVAWRRLGLPPSADEHGRATRITTMAVASSEVYVGSPHGLFASSFTGPLHQVAFPSGCVRGLAMDTARRMLWATSASGPLVSADGGRSWSPRTAGLHHPADASAIASLGQDVFVSDGTGVFRWQSAARSWVRTSSARSVTVLNPSPGTGMLYASTEGADLLVLTGGRWTDLGPPSIHMHHGHMPGQPAIVTAAHGRLYAVGTPDGVSASADDGWTWTQLGGGLSSTTPNQVIGLGDGLLAATSDGLYRFPLAAGGGATPGWWAVVLALAVGLGVAAAAVGAYSPIRRAAAGRAATSSAGPTGPGWPAPGARGRRSRPGAQPP